jgi:hypothetical protein
LTTEEKKKPLAKKPTQSRATKTRFQIAQESLLHLYDTTIGVLNQGIKTGATDQVEGLISFLVYCDILHGGAYTVPINLRPFSINNKSVSPYWAGGDLINKDAQQGLLGWLGSIFGAFNAGPLVQEIFENANVPHVFPKLISDETFALVKTTFAWFTSTDLLKSAGTGVTTFVEAANSIVSTQAEAAKTLSEAAKNVGLDAEQAKSLVALLGLIP